jgi:N-acetylmuramoyl-L-alanine amidase
MRRIDNIVVHCTGTPKNTRVQSIINYWRNVLKWKSNGYHVIIDNNGVAQQITPLEQICNGVAGHNSRSIHIAYIGGEFRDDRNQRQKDTLILVIKDLLMRFPKARVLGHRDFPNVTKKCPQFNAISEYKNLTR